VATDTVSHTKQQDIIHCSNNPKYLKSSLAPTDFSTAFSALTLLLGSRKGIRPVKNWAVGCWRVICLEWGADSTGKYRQNKLNTNQKNTAKQNYPGSVAFYNTRPANEVSLFYNAPEPTRGKQSGITAHRKKVTLVYWHTHMLHTEQHSMFIPSLKPLKIWRFLITVRGMVSVCVRTFTPVGLWIAHERLRTCLFVHYIKLHNNSHLYGHW